MGSLYRALALAGVIRARYPRLDAVFAPHPSAEKPDGENGTAYDHVRPLMGLRVPDGPLYR